MDKIDFSNKVADCFEGLETDEAIEIRAKKMIQYIEIYKIQAKEYVTKRNQENGNFESQYDIDLREYLRKYNED